MSTRRRNATRELTELGRRISQLRQARGLSQEALAWEVGIHTNHLSTIERGVANPSFAVLLVISRALQTSLGELLRDIG